MIKGFRTLINKITAFTFGHKVKNIKKFNVTVEMQERWIPHFMSMLKHMEQLGKLGSSRTVSFYSDGDGDFRPKFLTNYKYEIVKPSKDNNGNRFYDAG